MNMTLRRFSAAITACLSCSLTLIAQDGALSSATTGVIEAYQGTKEPRLPDPEGWELLDSPVSAAPGRMRLPKNIVVDKPHTRLYIINVFGDTLGRYRVCASLKRGQKTKADDWKTPEGTFRIHGIHGTNAPYSVPGRRSHGCMRMRNEDIVRVRRMVDKDSRVTILPDPVETETAD